MRRVAVVSLVLLGLAPAHAGAQAPRLTPLPPSSVPRPCPAVAPDAGCGTVTAPLDHTGATAAPHRIVLAVLPATGTRTGTLAVLLGGPGQAGTSGAKALTLER